MFFLHHNSCHEGATELTNYFVTIDGSSNEDRDLDVINLVMGMDGHKIEMSRLINSWPTDK